MLKKNTDEHYYNVLRMNIRKYRRQKKYTQQALAELVGISSDYLCEIESTKKNKSFSIAVLGRIADALEIDIRNFFDN